MHDTKTSKSISATESQTLKRLLKPEEVAGLLGVSIQTLYNGCARRAKHPFPIQPKRVGRLLRFRAADVAAYLENQ